jgi:hypothetical protein
MALCVIFNTDLLLIKFLENHEKNKTIFRKILPIISLYFQFSNSACFLNIHSSCRTNDIVLCVLEKYCMNMNEVIYIYIR